MYPILSLCSYILRFMLAQKTIENISIFDNSIMNYYWAELISIYTILLIISRSLTGLFYDKSMPSIVGVFIYFIIYCVLLLIYWLILLFLTWIGILPVII